MLLEGSAYHVQRHPAMEPTLLQTLVLERFWTLLKPGSVLLLSLSVVSVGQVGAIERGLLGREQRNQHLSPQILPASSNPTAGSNSIDWITVYYERSSAFCCWECWNKQEHKQLGSGSAESPNHLHSD